MLEKLRNAAPQFGLGGDARETELGILIIRFSSIGLSPTHATIKVASIAQLQSDFLPR
jgi:hypothetical protein